MNLYYWFYHGLIGTALLMAILGCRYFRQYRFIMVLLSATLVVELIAEFMHQAKLSFSWLYHLFVPIEYSLLCLYYLVTDGSRNKWQIKWSIPVFLVFSSSVSFFFYQFDHFPGININIEGLAIFVLYTQLLFNLQSNNNLPLYRQADFWIAISLLLFFGGTFFVNAVYTPFLHMDKKRAMRLFATINKPLNILLYTGIIIGILCSIRNRKYFSA